MERALLEGAKVGVPRFVDATPAITTELVTLPTLLVATTL